MFVLLLLCALGVTHAQNIQVNTTEGWVEGQRASDGNYNVFYGIPYAGPTDGQNRFKAPTPPIPFPNLFHAMDSNVICAQPSERGLIGVENCLTLSIFTNNVTTPKPVIVWLNAEEYTTSSTTLQSFRRFVEEGIVVVSMNFRLSIFGFLCLGVPEAPGNAGIKDVIQGLRWIKSNIGGFGGNPDNVMLMGHSSAAAIVDLVTMAPQATNLVHKAVALSGSALAPWAVAYDPIGYAQILAKQLSYTGKSPSELAKLLVTTDISLIGTALNGFNFYNNTPLFAPCIENQSLNDTVLNDAPINLLKSGNYSHIPYIGGYVNKEGTLRAEEALFEGWLEKMEANFTDFLQVDLDFGTNLTARADTIKNFYFSGSPVSMANINDYLAYHGDTLVVVSAIRGARERAATSRSEVRLLEFAFLGTLNSDWTYNQIQLDGVRHGGLLNYLFDFDLRPAEDVVRQSILRRFSSFAQTGNPTPATSAAWNPITPQSLAYMLYSGAVTAQQQTAVFTESTRTDPHTIRMILWNQLYAENYKAPLPVSSASRLMNVLSVVVIGAIFVNLF
nr:putative antennal esterase CXE6 [Ectropis grisescens]